jgi:hypothetical protein
LRAVLFALTGIAFFVFWAVAHPSFEMTASMTEWPQVLWFSATLFVLALALREFGLMVGGARVGRWAGIAGAGAGLSSVANIFEDGFGIDAAFFGFIAGTLTLVPIGTVIGIVLFVVVGGPVMLVTWLGAAGAAATVAPPRAPIPATPPSP